MKTLLVGGVSNASVLVSVLSGKETNESFNPRVIHADGIEVSRWRLMMMAEDLNRFSVNTVTGCPTGHGIARSIQHLEEENDALYSLGMQVN